MLREQLPIPLPFHYAADYDDAAGIDTDQAAADVGFFSVPFKCEVFLAQLIIRETCGGSTTTPVVDFDKRPTIGSDTDRGAADIAHFICGVTAAGKVVYDEVGVGTVLYPGDEIVVQIVTQPTGAGAAGHFIPVLLVVPIPESIGNLTDLVATT